MDRSRPAARTDSPDHRRTVAALGNVSESGSDLELPNWLDRRGCRRMRCPGADLGLSLLGIESRHGPMASAYGWLCGGDQFARLGTEQDRRSERHCHDRSRGVSNIVGNRLRPGSSRIHPAGGAECDSVEFCPCSKCTPPSRAVGLTPSVSWQRWHPSRRYGPGPTYLAGSDPAKAMPRWSQCSKIFILRDSILRDEHHPAHRTARKVHFPRVRERQSIGVRVRTDTHHEFASHDSEAHIALHHEAESPEHFAFRQTCAFADKVSHSLRQSLIEGHE